jgi:hypothetical protein
MNKTIEQILGPPAYSHECGSFIEVYSKDQVIEFCKTVHDQAVERCAEVAEMKVVTYSAPTMPSRTIIDKSSILKVKDELK